jgi:hypothetical protein
MAPENAADGTASRTDPPTPPEPPTARPPMVAAYLSSGNGVARRAQGTTVADARMKRRPAPTLDSVQARIGAHLPIQLHRTTLPSAVRDATLVAPDTPRTTVPGADRSYAYGSDAVAGFVGGLGGASKRGRRTRTSPSPKAAAGIRPMAAKDVVVLTLPDAAVDSDGRRPSLEVSGSARVSVLAGGGAVLADDVVTGQVDIPPGAALIAVQADGTLPGTGAEAGPDTVLDGLAGWQAGTRICALGSGAALGPGCVVTVQASPAAPGVAWTTAGALFGNAATVFTRFSRAVTTIAVVVSGAEAGRLDAMDLELIGATLARAADGSQRAPVVVLSGNQAVAVYAVEPDATAGRIAAVSVRVRAGGDWHVDGVLGGDVSVGDLTSAIVRRGVAGAAGRLLAGTGAGCTVSWQERPPPGTPKPVRRTSRRATAKAATNATRAAGSTAPARKGGLPHGRQ